ncbi:hypothetical protein F4553_000366 [Allocatelliglobosispora scoriae]|uniref:Uncharacterized protein n=1 Tax=Allocatelliglobosispora scoriae TaxID=643052 RepID=A0A841BD05_9ACTN|nr:hypothetical protein [Allocatelliglobosispora scoriae]MBB5866987.1 hypothetical protein [Allocatelliglobosispora scoriae]
MRRILAAGIVAALVTVTPATGAAAPAGPSPAARAAQAVGADPADLRSSDFDGYAVSRTVTDPDGARHTRYTPSPEIRVDQGKTRHPGCPIRGESSLDQREFGGGSLMILCDTRYRVGMTEEHRRRMTISFPADVAEILEGVPNASAYITAAVRRQAKLGRLHEVLGRRGITVTPEGVARAGDRLRAAEGLRRAAAE